MLFVTMLYDLDRTGWGNKWQRPFNHYLHRFLDLLKSLDSNVELLVFSDNANVEKLCSFFPQATYIHFNRYWFRLNAHRHRIRSVATRLFIWSSPEFTQGEYIYLQLCKFEAIHLAMKWRPSSHLVWIDGGFRFPPPQWKNILKYCNSKIYGLQCAQASSNKWLILNTPTQHVQGSFWGGDRNHMEWLANASLELTLSLLSEGECANDQQILSLLHSTHPDKFSLRKSYLVVWPGVWSTGNTGVFYKHLSMSTDRIQYSYFLGIVIALVLFIQGQLYFSKTSILTQQMMARHLEYPGIST